MANLLNSALGNKGIAKVAGQKAGEVVEGAVKKALGGAEGKKEGAAADAGKKDDNKAGFDAGDVLSLVGVGDKKEGEGLDVKKSLGGLFN